MGSHASWDILENGSIGKMFDRGVIESFGKHLYLSNIISVSNELAVLQKWFCDDAWRMHKWITISWGIGTNVLCFNDRGNTVDLLVAGNWKQ